MSGRARLWAPGLAPPGDYLTLEFAEFYPAAGDDPAEDILDDRGVLHSVADPTAKRWITALTLYVDTLDLNLLNNTNAATRRRLPDWLRWYCLANRSLLTICTEEDGRGVEPDGSLGAAYVERRAYKCVLNQVPPALLGTRNRLGGASGLETLTFKVFDQGTFSDFGTIYSGVTWEGR